MDLLDRLLGRDRRTTARFLGPSGGLTAARRDRPFGLGHGAVGGTVAHTSGCVGSWAAAMTGQPAAGPGDDGSPAAPLDRRRRACAAFAAFARRMRDERRLGDASADPDAADTPLTFGGAIVHVVRHNARHRGEGPHLLERLGAPGLPEGNPLGWELPTHGP